MHEALYYFASGSVSAPAPDDSVKIAIITAISVVLAAIVTAFTTTFSRHKNDGADDHSAQSYVEELIRRAETAERHSAELEKTRVELETTRQALNDHVDDLERYCWHAGIDPSTGRPVVKLIKGEAKDDA